MYTVQCRVIVDNRCEFQQQENVKTKQKWKKSTSDFAGKCPVHLKNLKRNAVREKTHRARVRQWSSHFMSMFPTFSCLHVSTFRFYFFVLHSSVFHFSNFSFFHVFFVVFFLSVFTCFMCLQGNISGLQQHPYTGGKSPTRLRMHDTHSTDTNTERDFLVEGNILSTSDFSDQKNKNSVCKCPRQNCIQEVLIRAVYVPLSRSG